MSERTQDDPLSDSQCRWHASKDGTAMGGVAANSGRIR